MRSRGIETQPRVVPVGPQHDELAGGLDCEHVLAGAVRDSALMLDLTSGVESTTRYPLKRPAESFVAAANAAVPRLRIGVALRAPGGMMPIDEIGAAVEQTAAALRGAGHTLSEFQFSDSAKIGEKPAFVWMGAPSQENHLYP